MQPVKKGVSSNKKRTTYFKEAPVDIQNIYDIDLHKYCPQKVFNVVFINECDEQSKEMLARIIEASGEFEEVSYIRFITYDAVLGLAENCDSTILPPPLQFLLKEVSNQIKGSLQGQSDVPPELLAQLMKLKLVEVMYRDYIKAVDRMQRRRKLQDDLINLIGRDRDIESKFKRIDDLKPKVLTGRSTSSKVFKDSQSTMSTIDYTSIPIDTNDDIIYDDNIHHYVSYYAFCGFYNPALLREIIEVNKVDVQCLVKFTCEVNEDITSTDGSAIYSDYWDMVYNYFDGPRRPTFLENTFLMNYKCTDSGIKETFEKLLNMIRKVINIKLYHLNYIRHLKILQDKDIYNFFPLHCLTVYNNLLQKVPMELVSVPFVLDALLKQVCVSVEEVGVLSENTSQHCYINATNFEASKCIDPCSLQAFFKQKLKFASDFTTGRKSEKTFMAYEGDETNIILNSYKKSGALIYDASMKVLANLQPLNDLQLIEDDYYNEIIHTHDRDPSTKTEIKNKDIILHFIYMFLFSCFQRKDTLVKIVETPLRDNIETFDKLKFFQFCQIKSVDSSDANALETDDNLYSSPAVRYFWKEKLESSVLLQELFKAQNEYLYMDQRFSPETDNLLIQFCDHLDQFGINVKVYEQSLPTPICLRDFCRYTIVEKSEWLETNKPSNYIKKQSAIEECQGAKKNAKYFSDYYYLLETNTPNTIEPDKNQGSGDATEEITLDDLIEELRNYPTNINIVKECLKSDKPKTCPVYDLGTRYFQVRGARTTFQSHDDVKLCVDNTKILDDMKKCSLTLNCRENSLVIHSNTIFSTEDFNFHFNLSDGTLLSFIIYKSKTHKENLDVIELEEDPADDELNVDDISDLGDFIYVARQTGENNVFSVDKTYFETAVKTSNLLNEEFTGSKKPIFKPFDCILESLKQAVNCGVPIYKVNNDLTHIKKLKSQFEIPLTMIVKRILHSEIQEFGNENLFTKRYLPIPGCKEKLEYRNILDARIALPNGLYVTFYPSTTKKNIDEVKQEYVCYNSQTMEEEFRLFTRSGYILIKKINGDITVLKSNGDVGNHHKIDNDYGNVYSWRITPCHCKNIDDYRKRVGKIFKKENAAVREVQVSRRACYKTKKGNVENRDTLDIIEKHQLPYLKSTLLKFNGDFVCLELGRLTVKKMFYTTCENNFAAQEICYERSDSFKCTFDRYGKQTIEFSDGSTITSIPHVAKDLVDGYVYISLKFKYGHPNYATVEYDLDNTLSIVLNNNVILKKEVGSMSLKVDEDITTTIDKNKVVFEKSCTACDSKYVCDVNINPLVTGKIDFSKNFVHAYDTYNKHFYCDFEGNCERNADYIRGPINRSDCNHYKKLSYKKLFVVNRNLTGETFWTDNMVVRKKMQEAHNKNSCLVEYKDATNSGVQVYKFKRKMFDSYSNRFIHRVVSSNPRDVFIEPIYSTFRVLRRMVDAETIKKFSQDLGKFFRDDTSNFFESDVFFVLDKMNKENETSRQRDEQIVARKSSVIKTESCQCIQQKIGIPGKIQKWKNECEKYRALIRKRALPCYFNSEFCQVIERK